ncbi:hypothetical protein MSG28_012718 [Choristoneura fumiferana]|uniref:Uncharacterized protein n=1 Tax=Choristoneura fumiferana TaxID=7141 RepID=A0ACC0JHP8_CHOFU|nr:hypothetical protein MSG28_012718 [Choristoneura fumiferana]
MVIGIIGGSGFDDPALLEERTEHRESTPFGEPSDVLIEGRLRGVPCVLLARHGRKHQLQPSDVNYRANIWALRQRGCSHVLATTATGSLREHYRPGDLVVLNDYIDRTWGRKCTFYDRTEGGPRGVCHLPQRPAFCARARAALVAAARAREYAHHETGTAVVIQGPRFSSRAESLMHRQWGGDLVNMTTVPEVVLAKEAGLSYAALALVTDYDCWRDNETSRTNTARARRSGTLDVLIEGRLRGVPCVLLARHGRKHQLQPSDRELPAPTSGRCCSAAARTCSPTTATGSLREHYRPGTSSTWGRKCTFYDRTEGGPRGVCPLPQRPAFCARARAALVAAARARGYTHHETGTAVVIQGPRFSSRAESLMHRQWGGDLVNMTTVPEVVLAKEAGLSYAALALVTDYDCWRDNETSVSVSEVLAMFSRNVQKAADVIVDAVQLLASETDLGYLDAHQVSTMTYLSLHHREGMFTLAFEPETGARKRSGEAGWKNEREPRSEEAP